MMVKEILFLLVILNPPPVIAQYRTVYVNSSLTHKENDTRTYLQRYLVNSSFWIDDGPIFFYSGNEGDITEFWEASGWIQVLARKMQALIVFGEARYYGQSIPNEFGFLSTELILADYAAALRTPNVFLPKKMNASLPVISFGGSYGGTLTTFFRAAYPDLVIGGLAASAPIGYYDSSRWHEFNVSEFTFTNIIATAYSDCIHILNAAISAINIETNTTALIKKFHACSLDTLTGNSTPPQNSALFVYMLESLPQLNYPYPVSGLPAYPVNAVCSAFDGLVQRDDIIDTAANLTKNFFSIHDSCMPPLSEGPGNIPGDGPGLGSWGYQSCSENLHLFSSQTPIRNYTFNLTAQNSLCSSLYHIQPNISKLTALYGGYDLPMTTTSLFFSNGALDPWHGGGFLQQFFPDSPNQFCFMPNGAHHLDLRAPNDADPQDVVKCRQAEESAIRSWLTNFYSSRSNASRIERDLDERG